jgi:peptide-methionine (S)-S-oxide reductase
VGTQYRSIILYQNLNQKQEAQNFIDKLNSETKAGQPIVTEVKALAEFYPAEDYHQNYFEKNPNKIYCTVTINPKLKKVKEKFSHLLKPGI